MIMVLGRMANVGATNYRFVRFSVGDEIPTTTPIDESVYVSCRGVWFISYPAVVGVPCPRWTLGRVAVVFTQNNLLAVAEMAVFGIAADKFQGLD